ncbi:MAG: SOS response-associated peptidase family protein [Burkholderiales bacterium]|nr:SOS response-associated peptidase family protein [Burkholderiales bacterium]
MCGRYSIYGPRSLSRTEIEFLDQRLEIKPRYNAARTDSLPVYRVHPDKGQELVQLRWRLIPSWAKDEKIGARLINARAETVDTLPAFKNALSGGVAWCWRHGFTNGRRRQRQKCHAATAC